MILDDSCTVSGGVSNCARLNRFASGGGRLGYRFPLGPPHELGTSFKKTAAPKLHCFRSIGSLYARSEKDIYIYIHYIYYLR